MSTKNEIIDFTIRGYKRTGNALVTDKNYRHVLANKYDNFFGPKPKFKFHRWASSLKSSQAFAYNIFSNVENVKFEYSMWALDNNASHKASIDVAVEYPSGLVKMYEVKMFEITHLGKDQIFHTDAQKKYFDCRNYAWNKEIAEIFILFINRVIKHFNNQSIYGSGIKQLCCHLLGIINEMTIKNGKLIGKKVELYSLCFDNTLVTKRFEKAIANYMDTLKNFKNIVDEFLAEINLDIQIQYLGFLPASNFIKQNIDCLGKKNVDYVWNRYFYNQEAF